MTEDAEPFLKRRAETQKRYAAFPSYPRELRELSEGERRWVLPSATGATHLDPKNWYHRTWLPWLARCAVPKPGKATIRDFHFHDLRHTTATRLGLAGARIRDIATALGHADDRMAQRYEHAALGDGYLLGVNAEARPPVPRADARRIAW